jgi:hypothetical protein
VNVHNTPEIKCPIRTESRKVGSHAFLVTCRRPWRRLWRRQYVITCWWCALEIPEP